MYRTRATPAFFNNKSIAFSNVTTNQSSGRDVGTRPFYSLLLLFVGGLYGRPAFSSSRCAASRPARNSGPSVWS